MGPVGLERHMVAVCNHSSIKRHTAPFNESFTKADCEGEWSKSCCRAFSNVGQAPQRLDNPADVIKETNKGLIPPLSSGHGHRASTTDPVKLSTETFIKAAS